VTADPASAANSARTREIAAAFWAARQAARALPGFPGPLPDGLEAAYAIQEAGIPLRDAAIAGWKVGRIPPQAAAALGVDHLAGPIYDGSVWSAGATPTPIPAIAGGFCAVEAEFVFRLGEDAPASKLDWTPEDGAGLVAALHIGVEIAGSPMAAINILGPTAVVADGGNNAGLILGPQIAGWQARDPNAMTCETFIDGASVGRGSAGVLLGGPLGSLAFILAHLARRGRPARAGQLIATGQTSGIHDIAAGQAARVAFGALGEINCVAMPAQGRV
jgi:2-keto-4-pentenoate hydratase